MVVSANGELVLATLEDLKILLEAEAQELHEQFSKYKKYKKELAELEEWEKGDTTGFIDDVESLIRKNRLSKDNEYRLAVYMGRYPSYFFTIKNRGNTSETMLKDRLLALKEIEAAVESYVKVLIEIQ